MARNPHARKARPGTKDQKRMHDKSAATLARKFEALENPPPFARGCTGKTRYDTKGHATSRIGPTRRLTNDDRPLTAYHCRDGCGGWHLGHDRK